MALRHHLPRTQSWEREVYWREKRHPTLSSTFIIALFCCLVNIAAFPFLILLSIYLLHSACNFIITMELISKKGKTLHSQAREILNAVTQFCDLEAENQELQIPVGQSTKRAAAATGVSASTIKRIRREAKNSDQEGEKLSTPGKHRCRADHTKVIIDDFDKSVIRNTINEFYIQKKIVPSVPKLLPILKEKINFPWKREALRRVLHDMGFRWKKCCNLRHVLMEKPNIISWRYNFLREIRKYRSEGRAIIYLDETWVDSNMSVQKCWQMNGEKSAKISINSGNRLIVVHAGGVGGFIPNAYLVYKAGSTTGDYHGQMNSENFEKWLNVKLIPNLPSNCVICFDNASYHTKKVNCAPSKYATKKDMMKWLTEKNIKFEETMRKPDIFKLVAENSPPSPVYRVEELLKGHGHDTIRLPPYHCDLNPIELAWGDLKRFIRERNVDANLSMTKLKELTEEALQTIDSSKWETYISHVQNIEKNYWEKDGIVEDIVDELIISFGGEDSENENSYSSDCSVITDDDEIEGIELLQDEND